MRLFCLDLSGFTKPRSNLSHNPVGLSRGKLYLTDAVDGKRMRLLGFERMDLEPGQSQTVTVTADPRLLEHFDKEAAQWRIATGRYQISVGSPPGEIVLQGDATLVGRLFGSCPPPD